jgi:hypothetical protein
MDTTSCQAFRMAGNKTAGNILCMIEKAGITGK